MLIEGIASLGVGIPGMRERLRQLGGQLEVDFGRNGTRVIAVVPMRKPEVANADLAEYERRTAE